MGTRAAQSGFATVAVRSAFSRAAFPGSAISKFEKVQARYSRACHALIVGRCMPIHTHFCSAGFKPSMCLNLSHQSAVVKKASENMH
jgi:hypothetical protein